MTKDELISKQQLEIENFKEMMADNEKLRDALFCKLYCIGQPLNDNILKFNSKQLKWCFEIDKLVSQLN